MFKLKFIIYFICFFIIVHFGLHFFDIDVFELFERLLCQHLRLSEEYEKILC